MTVSIHLKGLGGVLVVVAVIGAILYTSPEMVQQAIDYVQQNPLISVGFVVLLVVLVVFGNAAPGDDAV